MHGVENLRYQSGCIKSYRLAARDQFFYELSHGKMTMQITFAFANTDRNWQQVLLLIIFVRYNGSYPMLKIN